jgi:hypothetical protein
MGGSVSFLFIPMVDVQQIAPSVGSVSGGTPVYITANTGAFSQLVIYVCLFGGETSLARYFSSSKIMCISPKMNNIGNVYVALMVESSVVSMDKSQSSGVLFNGISFGYYVEPAVIAISPASGSVQGGDEIEIFIRGLDLKLLSSMNVLCMFDSSVVTGRVLFDTTITCVSPPYTAVDGAGENQGVISVSIAASLNGVDFFTTGSSLTLNSTNNQNNGLSQILYEYITEPSVTLLTPFHGPAGGGTVIDVIGIGFIKDTIYQCNFEGIGRSQASRINSYLLRCITPEFGNGSVIPFSISYDSSSSISLDIISSSVFQVDPPVMIYSVFPSQTSSSPPPNSVITVR